MKTKLIAVFTFYLILCAATPGLTQSSIQEGAWKGTSDIEFTVVNQTTINPFKVKFTFTPPPCSGSITITFKSNVAIINRSLKLDFSGTYPYKESGTLTGNFSADGKSISGSYTYKHDSCQTSANWSAAPSQLPPTNPTGTGTATPSTVSPEAVILLAVTVTPGTNPPSTGISVVGNLSEIGGSSSQRFFDDGTNGDETPADSRHSYRATIAPATTPGNKTIPVTISDGQSRSSNTAIQLTVQKPTSSGAEFTCIYPQIAVGGLYNSYISVAEPYGFPAKHVSIELFDDNGLPLMARFDGGNPSSSFSFSLEDWQEKVIKLSGASSALKTGWARLKSSPGCVDSSIRFVVSGDGYPDLVKDAVGVLPTKTARYWTVTVDSSNPDALVGVAIANPAESSLEVEFNLWSKGNRVANTSAVKRAIPPRGHMAAFVYQIFNTQFQGVGTLTISGGEMSVMALRMDGAEFSSLPAFKLSSIWNWTATQQGLEDLAGEMHLGFLDKASFAGLLTTSTPEKEEVALYGSIESGNFIAERLLVNKLFNTTAVDVYIGTLGVVGGDEVIEGIMVRIKNDGTQIFKRSFKATRTY